MDNQGEVSRYFLDADFRAYIADPVACKSFPIYSLLTITNLNHYTFKPMQGCRLVRWDTDFNAWRVFDDARELLCGILEYNTIKSVEEERWELDARGNPRRVISDPRNGTVHII